MLQRTSLFSLSGSKAARQMLLAAAVILALPQAGPTAQPQEGQEEKILEEYALPTGLGAGEAAVYQVVADQLGVIPASGMSVAVVAEAVTGAGFEVISANEDRNIVIARPLGLSKNYAELRAEATDLMAKAGEAVQWVGPVVRTKPINNAEPKDRGDILIPTDVVIVKFHADVAEDKIKALADENGLVLLKSNPVDKREFYFQLNKDRSDVNVFTASQGYAKAGITEYVTPNFYLFIDVRAFVPNDPFFDRQWPLNNTGQNNGLEDADIDADLAWAFGRGDPSTIIAVIDGGFDMTHPDLAPNFFRNAGEGATNSIDDDGNGYVDDKSGWDFVPCWGGGLPGCGDNDPSGPDTKAEARHGTMTAGAAAAAGNNARGVSGSCPNCSLLPLRIQVPIGAISQQVSAFGYAQLIGAHIITNSWGYRLQPPTTTPIVNAINNAHAAGAVIFFAMATTKGYNEDCLPRDISSLANVIGVSASNNADTRTPAGYGNCMDVLAPTDNYLATAGTLWAVSTDMTGAAGYNSAHPISDCVSTEFLAPPADSLSYTFCANGTSYAAPLTAGVSGLMETLDGSLTPLEHQRILQDTADKIEPAGAAYDPDTGFSSPTVQPTPQATGSLGGVGSTHGYGRVNAFEAARLVAPAASGGRGGVDVFLRDNQLDWGNTERPSNLRLDNPRGFIAHYTSTSIKIDAPPYEAMAPATGAQFAAFPDEDPLAGAMNRVHLLVRNRGPNDATNVTVKLLWTFAGTALPALPVNFWSMFPADPAVTTPWTVIGTTVIPAVGYSGASIATQAGDGARVVSFNFTAPALDPSQPAFRHYCLFAVLDSPDDPVSAVSQTSLAPDAITPGDNNVTHRNVSLRDPATGGGVNAGLMIRNPFDGPIESRVIIDRPGKWNVSLKGASGGETLKLPPGAEIPIEVQVDRPGEAATGEVHIRQEVLRDGKYEPLGGFLFRFAPDGRKQPGRTG